MLKNTNTKRATGFTIIEVLIVLAVAGLILLIVFLAVPALQRNAHNTSIKNDAAGLLGGVTEYVNNNNGLVPTGVSGGATTGVNIGASGTNTSAVKLGYISGLKVTLTTLSGTATPPTATDTAVIYTNAVCNTTATAATSTGATSRNFVVLYLLEGGAKECQAS